jgi:rhamnose utilization protein RhaD (predicted bifunctional aldolase and dehydrogenase)
MLKEVYKDELKDLEIISSNIGKDSKYVQGGGGNTSVKLDDELMAVKASGFKLKQITENKGFVVVNYKNIKEYYENIDFKSNKDYESDSIKFAQNNIVTIDGIETLRPSVEAGFHSILEKYVIHTHPVYANILCCSKEGKDLLKKIFSGSKWDVLWVPYVNPGFYLTLEILNGIKDYKKEKKRPPNIIFMENHGFIAASDDKMHCMKLHNEANRLIKEYLKIEEDYPKIVIEKIPEQKKDIYVSNTKYLRNFFKDNKINNDHFEKIILYPDQLVYLNESVSINGKENKLNIDTRTGELLYHTDYQEATTIEETLLAYTYVINKIKDLGLTVKSMPKDGSEYIRNWESEKYRKSIKR